MEPELWHFEGGSQISIFHRTNILPKRLYHIAAMISLKRFRVVTQYYAASFSVKTLFCKTNIFYSLEKQI